MPFLLYLSAVIIGFIDKKSKYVTCYIVSVMIFLAAFRTTSADFTLYVYEYYHVNEGANSAGRYIGYKYLVKLFSDLGLSFEAYLLVFYSVLFLILAYSISKLTEKINVVLALYMLFPYALDVVQMKSFAANIIAFAGIVVLFEGMVKKKNKNLLYFVIIEIIAGSMHFAAFFYLFAGIFITIIKQRNKLKKWVFFIAVVLIPLVYLGISAIIIQNAIKLGLIGTFDSNYMEHYYSVGTRFGAVIPTMWTICLIVFSLKTIHFNYKMINDGNSRNEYIVNYILTAAILIPFFIIYIYISRLLRVYMILMYVLFAEFSESTYSKMRMCARDLLFYVALFIGVWMDEYFVMNGTILSLLRYNMFLS